MSRRAVLLLSLLAAAQLQAQADRPRRGVIATHKDAAGTEVVRLEPILAVHLRDNESLHPRLTVAGNVSRWEGTLNLTRADTYHFRAQLRGRLKLTIGGKEVLNVESKAERPTLVSGGEVRLEAGVAPLVAEFVRLPGAARVEVLWSSKSFREEPLPFDVLGHLVGAEGPRFQADALAEEGRFLAEEHACAACHGSEKGLTSRQGPDLSKVGSRVHGEWLYRWLESPKKLRPGSVMPELFAADENGAVERYAATRYLMTLGGPLAETKPADDKERIDRGRQTFMSVGCVACHGPVGQPPPMREDDEEEPRPFVLHRQPRLYPFKGMGGKTTPEKLTAFLLDPRAVNPNGRMPHMLLTQKEAKDLAQFLCAASGAKDHKLPDAPGRDKRAAAFQRLGISDKDILELPDDRQWVGLGKEVVQARGCVGCHTIAPEGKALPTFAARTKFDQLSKKTTGCLADAEKKNDAPQFRLSAADRTALRALVDLGVKKETTVARAHAAQTTLRRFNCLACHQRDGEGGLSSALTQQLRKFEKAENAEAVVPPPLTGVGQKLRTPWLREVLTKAGRARPWMGLRMPQFGEANVGHLSEGLALLEGTDLVEAIHRVKADSAAIGAGRFLVGNAGFNCVGCHDIAGHPNHGTRGPDLATMGERVRFDWYLRWLENAQRIQPGTRMPTVFQDGKSLLDKVHKGDANAQAEAMWAYLALGPKLTLPEGVGPALGLQLTVKERPIVFRTFLPDAGTRAIAVGYPDGLSLAFDATRCRLSYAWTGNFLDVSPVWNERGGNPARVLGPRLWTAPPGSPWTLGDGDRPPDFAARAKEPGFGGDQPELKWHDGPRPLRFDGYSTDAQGRPTFRYRLGLKLELVVQERLESLRSAAGAGLLRRFTLEVPAGQTAWMLAGESTATPRLLDERGKTLQKDVKDGARVPGHRIVALPQGKEQVVLLRLAGEAREAEWYLRRNAGQGWEVTLRLPPTKAASTQQIGVAVWVPHRDEPALIETLLTR